jgi:hypothetical protein
MGLAASPEYGGNRHLSIACGHDHDSCSGPMLLWKLGLASRPWGSKHAAACHVVIVIRSC